MSAIYSDRYANMISYIYDHRSMSLKEIRSSMIRDLNKHQLYFCVKDIVHKDVFCADEDQTTRTCMTSMVNEYRRSKADPMDLAEALSLIR